MQLRIKTRYYGLFLAIALANLTAFAQPITSVRFTFDDCDLTESESQIPPGVIAGDPECMCGLEGNSFYFNGNDTLTLSPDFSDLFTRESFTFNFYFTLEEQSTEMDIFSASSACTGNDSTMYLKYLGSTGELVFVIGNSINNILLAQTPLDKNICWHRFTLVKVKTEYFLYINNTLVKNFVSRETLPISRNRPLTFGYNFCRTLGSVPFRGQIDDISWISQSLSPFEISSSYLYPDQVINRDTTIFLGSQVDIMTGNTCASAISWTPLTSLDVSDVFQPIASPETSTTYYSTVNYRHCTVKDSTRVYVVDKNLLECNKILLPKAFTPNGDNLNDRYGISNQFIIESFSYFEILDRSGAVLWRTESLNETWDGNFLGAEMSSGVYFYKVKYNCGGEEYLKIDSFSVMR